MRYWGTYRCLEVQNHNCIMLYSVVFIESGYFYDGPLNRWKAWPNTTCIRYFPCTLALPSAPRPSADVPKLPPAQRRFGRPRLAVGLDCGISFSDWGIMRRHSIRIFVSSNTTCLVSAVWWGACVRYAGTAGHHHDTMSQAIRRPVQTPCTTVVAQGERAPHRYLCSRATTILNARWFDWVHDYIYISTLKNVYFSTLNIFFIEHFTFETLEAKKYCKHLP